MARILIIDDDAAFRESLAETIQQFGHEVVEAATGEDGLKVLAQGTVDAVFLDFRMPGMSGIDVLRQRIDHGAPIVMLTAQASSDNTIEAMKLGALDHLLKPIGREDVGRVLERMLVREIERSRGPLEASGGEALVGMSASLREVQKRIGQAAASEAPVLILGETGTGKELVARTLHAHSARASSPFVAVNCAAIPRELLESELFGHVRGAFSGAVADRPGAFRSADGGILLLDEIGEMPLALQAKILRVLQDGEISPVGAAKALHVKVRVLAATHRDLPAEVRRGSFREDLLYRLNVLAIHVPPLRERIADIVPLAEHFLAHAAGDASPKSLSEGAARALIAHAWPGNVRELKNVMERCQTLAPHRVIGARDLASFLDAGAPRAADSVPADWLDADLPTATARLERVLITRALEQAGGNRAEAARRLGIHRQLLYQKLKTLGLD